jgi:lysine 2,3-aminomutase
MKSGSLKNIKNAKQLHERGLISEERIEGIEEVASRFSLSITNEMADLIEEGDDPIARQFVPSVKELNVTEDELADPIGDNARSPVKGIVHRYPDRCLFMPMTVCPVYCRFCFRREKVGSAESGLSRKELEAAFAYIESTPQIWEVILTGGDPLFMKPNLMKRIISRLSSIDHVDVIRLHTRVPVVDPKRVNGEMLKALNTDKALYVVLHANHVREFSKEAKKTIAKLVDSGIPMLSQSVLLKGINDDPAALENLFRELVRNRVKPYYLHHGDFAKGTSHFRTTIEEGRNLMKKIRGKVSGLCQPTYALDIPGGYGKAPINPDYLSEDEDGSYVVEDYRGVKHRYPQSPRQAP